MVDNTKLIRSMRDAFSMTKQRCYNPRNRDYPHYGGRGIGICQEWLDDFNNFLRDMGPRPEGMTLERSDNNKDYGPDNCVWATRLAQMSNTRKAKNITYKGKTKSISQWERELGFKPGTLKARIGQLGYSIDEAFTKPVGCGLQREGHKVTRGPADPRKLKRGLEHFMTKFSKTQVLFIRAERSKGASISHLAAKYSTSTTTIPAVCNGLRAYKGI